MGSPLRLISLLTCLLLPLQGGAALAQFLRVGVWLTNSPSKLYYSQQRLEQAVEQLEQAGFRCDPQALDLSHARLLRCRSESMHPSE